MKRRAVLTGLGGIAVLAMAAVGIWWVLQAGTSSSDGRPIEVDFQAGPFQLGLSTVPETPRVGENVLTLFLADSAGQPVSGASIEAVAEMPAMGAMPAMRAPAAIAEVEPGVYRGTFAPSMAGSWPLTMTIMKDGLGRAQVTFDLATGRAGLRAASGLELLAGAADSAVAGDAATGDEMPSMPGMSMADDVSGDEAERAASFNVDAGWQQAIGVRASPVGPRQIFATLRLPGRVTVDETGLVDVNLRTGGWIERLLVEETGQYVDAGDQLLELYSPELVTAQADLLLAIEHADETSASPSAEARDRARSLIDASRRRLLRLGLTREQIDTIAAAGEVQETLAILAPAAGHVLHKDAVEGMRVEPGMRLFQIADLSTVWVLADVYEDATAFAAEGLEAEFRLSHEPERLWRGAADFVYPTLDATTRSTRVRYVFPNPRLELRPEMFGDLVIRRDTSVGLAIPAEAVIDLGTSQVVFVDLGGGRLQAREVSLGVEAAGWYPVRAGLAEGDDVVVSGNFLIDAESKIRGVVPLPVGSRTPEEPR